MKNQMNITIPKRKLNSPQRTLIDACIFHFCYTARYDKLLSKDEKLRTAARELDPLWRCGEPILKLLRRQCEILCGNKGNHGLVLTRCNDLMEMAHEKFYAFPFKDVPVCWVELYREASLLKFSAISLTGVWGLADRTSKETPLLTEGQLDDMVQTMDMALIMTGPPRDGLKRVGVNNAMDLLQKLHIDSLETAGLKNDQPAAKRRKMDLVGNYSLNHHAFIPTTNASVANPQINQMNSVRRTIEPRLTDFSLHMLRPLDPDTGPEPIIICGALKDWPALNDRAWSDPEYLMAKTIGGRRLVPIETGKSYVHEDFGQRIIKFKEFMDKYILTPRCSGEPGYLAQHDLFSQIPSLREDIMMPDYCFLVAPGPHPSSPLAAQHSKLPKLEEPLLNAWFGPAGTTTPLHTDPYHNILAQVVGRKYIRLYAPRQSKNLYARGLENGIDMSNTSEMDVGVLAGLDGGRQEMADALEKFPLAKEAEFVECILEEGECLYIPVGWWHYVRSLSASFSVSFWYN